MVGGWLEKITNRKKGSDNKLCQKENLPQEYSQRGREIVQEKKILENAKKGRAGA